MLHPPAFINTLADRYIAALFYNQYLQPMPIFQSYILVSSYRQHDNAGRYNRLFLGRTVHRD